MDKALFEKTQMFRNLSSDEKVQFLQNAIQEMTREQAFNKEESAGAEFIKYLIALLFSLVGVDLLEEEKKDDQPAQEAA